MDNKKVVALAEDDKLLTEIYEANLKQQGYVVVATFNGDELIDYLLNNEKPNLIILDLLMPGKNGFDVLKFIKEHPEFHNIPLIILTNFEKYEMEKEVEEFATEYIIKSNISMADLVKKIEGYMKK